MQEENLPAGERTVPAGLYRHFKGKEYEVIGIALHSETEEELVVYRPLYGGQNQLWVRPKGMFLETVWHEGREIPRFYLVEKASG